MVEKQKSRSPGLKPWPILVYKVIPHSRKTKIPLAGIETSDVAATVGVLVGVLV